LQILGLFLRPIKKIIVSSERGQSISGKWIGLTLQKTAFNGKLIKIRLDFGQKCTFGTKCSCTELNVLAWNEIFLPAEYHLMVLWYCYKVLLLVYVYTCAFGINFCDCPLMERNWFTSITVQAYLLDTWWHRLN
jgi:hypothetical protein